MRQGSAHSASRGRRSNTSRTSAHSPASDSRARRRVLHAVRGTSLGVRARRDLPCNMEVEIASNCPSCADSRAEQTFVCAHVANFRTVFTELGLVRVHEEEFCARGASRRPLVIDHVGDFGARCIERTLTVEHVPRFNVYIPPLAEIRCAIYIETVLVAGHVLGFGPAQLLTIASALPFLRSQQKTLTYCHLVMTIR